MVECGFISNVNELKNLKDDQYQKKMALSIAIGIINYNISYKNYHKNVSLRSVGCLFIDNIL